MIDFAPVRKGEIKLLELSKKMTFDDLVDVTNQSIDTMLGLIKDIDDADVTFDPHDPLANDPHAIPGEEHIGWNAGHIIAHATASSEEWAAYSSILARGLDYAAEPRLRYETPWREMKTRAQCVQRLEESRRIRLSYLATWPDKPHLDVYRQMSERFTERQGQINAAAALLFGLLHESGHYDQLQEAIRQSKEAKLQARV